MILWEGLLILVMIGLNALFALSEYAIVSSRRQRLETRLDDGDQGARAALKLVDGIEEFIYAVQVGTTIVGIFAGALGGESLKTALASFLVSVGLSASVAGSLALLLVVAAITYFTLVLGELVPKRIALNDPERTASRVARLMGLLSRLLRPAVKLVGRPISR
jgi:putative hemolysin